jgi:hypothetical protein
MKTLGLITGSVAMVVLGGWAMFGDIPSNSLSAVRAQVRDLENPEGKVIPFGKDGIEVLTQGPVHEAFAQPATGRLEAEVTVRKQPPEPVPELPPEQKPEGDNVMWIPGYWGWDVDRNDFLWVSGFWRAVPPGRAWIPGYWSDDAGNWSWVSGYWADQTQTTVDLLPPPPDPIEEAAPPQEVADSTYVPGVWVYHEHNYRWRPGFWVGHRPGWNWVRAHYVWTPGGYCFVDGYWDHDFEHRGLLYAPVYFPQGYVRPAGWYHRPYYAIETAAFIASLFVRPVWGHYYFGDYYDARYSRLGFTPWLDYRVAGRWHDPAWNYYRWRYRNDARWEQNIRQAYVTRRQDTSARPPRTLAEQQRRAQSPQGAQIALVNPVTKLQSLQTSKVKLTTISKTEVEKFQKTAVNVQNFRDQRSKIELQAKSKAAIGPGKAPVTVQLQKPAELSFPKGQEAPPMPQLPKFGSQAPPKQPAQKQPGKKGGPDDDDKTPGKKKVTAPPDQPKKKAVDNDDPPGKKKVAPPPKQQPDPLPPPKKKAPPPKDDDDPPAKKAGPPKQQQPDPLPPPKKKAPPPKDDDPPAKKAPPPRQSDPPPPPPKKKAPDDDPPAKKAPPPKSKGKDKDDQSTFLRLGNPWQDVARPPAIFTQSTPSERGAFSPEDPRLFASSFAGVDSLRPWRINHVAHPEHSSSNGLF